MKLRKACKTEIDCLFIYNLRFDNDVMKQSMTNKRPLYKEHKKYYFQHYKEYDIIEIDHKFVGFLRIDLLNYISIAILEEHRRKGIGQEILKTVNNVKAIIKTNNKISLNAFEKSGFKVIGYYLEKGKNDN